MSKDNESESEYKVQVKPNSQTEVFSFEMPKGELKAKHVEAFLKFISENEAAHVMKSLLHIYFTALDDDFFQMDSVQKLCFERTLTLLADLSCENVCSKN